MGLLDESDRACSALRCHAAQVTRKWLNFEGRDVATHLADQLVALDGAVARLQAAAGAAGQGQAQQLGGLCKDQADLPAALEGGQTAAANVGSADPQGAASPAPTQAAAADAVSGVLSSWLAEQAAHTHGRTTSVLEPDEGAEVRPASRA